MTLRGIDETVDYMEEDNELEWDVTDTGYVLTSKWYINVPELEIRIRPGVYMQKYEDGEMVADWSLTALFDENDELLFYEEDSIMLTLHNYCHTRGWRLSEDMECEVVGYDGEEPGLYSDFEC